MKVRDLRRKLMRVLVAGGMLSPAALHAANLNTNLVVNPGFENVDFNVTGNYFGPQILDWANSGFAYSHDGNGGVPNYANGNPLASGGSFYFAPGSTDGFAPQHHSYATAISQVIDVSTGASATQIASGSASYLLRGFFNSYQTQTDNGEVQVDFLSAADAVLGSGNLTPGPVALTDWTQLTKVGAIPVGTAKVKVSVWGNLLQGGGADAYMDNIDFQVATVLPELSLTIDRTTGSVTLVNQTGASQNISSYSITSAFESLKPGSWLSITDNYDSGNPGPNQVDATHAWAKTSSVAGNLAENEPLVVGASLASGRTVNLGGSLWNQTYVQDLTFSYVSGGVTHTGIVNYTGGPGGAAYVEGDLNLDGVISAADWTIVRTNQHTNLSGLSLAQAYRLGDLTGDKANDHADFVAFKTLFDAVNGVGAFAAMVAAVPEPSSIALAVCTAGLVVLRRSRRSNDS